MYKRLWIYTALALCAASTASAQLGAHLDVGFSGKNDRFDKDGKREDFKDYGGKDQFLVPITLGVNYNVFRGAYVGADLSLLNRSETDLSNNKKSSFGIRELNVEVGWRGSLVIVDLAAHLGFKIDLGKKAEDLGTTDVLTSDNQHAVHVGLEALFSAMPMLKIGARVNAVFPLKREISKGVERQNGVVVDPALIIAGNVGVGALQVLFGLELGFFYQGETTEGTSVVADSDSNVLHLTPYVGVGFGQHKLKLSLALEEEDARIGIPLTGKNIEITTVPVTIGYEFQM